MKFGPRAVRGKRFAALRERLPPRSALLRALRCVVLAVGSTREPPANRREPPRGEA